jgi:ankyrin repeat protein
LQQSDTTSKRAIADAQATQLLLDNGFDIHVDSFKIKNLMLWAAENGHEMVVRLLLEMDADVKVKDSYERVALHRAASNGHEAVVRLLLGKGMDIGAKNSDRGLTGGTALH